MEYADFLQTKRIETQSSGFTVEPSQINPMLFDFQNDIVRWALERGKAAIFADCGLGKGGMQLEWARHVVERENAPVLILAPLAVSRQTIREGEKFSIEARLVMSDMEIQGQAIYVTNYEKLRHFPASKFAGVVLDESGILKSYTGSTRNALIERFAETPFKLCCTATPAPNDHMELGNHSEFLQVLTRTEMLSTFFVHDGGDTAKWRLKGHAEEEFWKWVCSWAVTLRKPSDLGYEDSGFILPPLNFHHHVVKNSQPLDGFLFAQEAHTLSERRQARRQSLEERTTIAADLVLNWQPCGNLNTPPTGSEKDNKTLTIASSVESRGHDRLTKIESTCEAGIPLTERKSKRITNRAVTLKDVEHGLGLDTLPILNIEPNENEKLKTGKIGTPIDGSRKDSNGLESHLSSTPLSSNDSAGSVPFAEAQLTDDINASSSIIVIKPNELEGSFADGVILESDNLQTIQKDLHAPLATCGKQWIVWVDLNAEQDALARLFGDRCVSIYGSLTNAEKENRLTRWLDGKVSILLSKPKIFGWGLNLQQCADVIFCGLSDSYEAEYQAIRRCWRFGQKNQVDCHVITSEAEGAVVKNIERKEKDATRMAKEMVKHMSVYNKAALHKIHEKETYTVSVEKSDRWEVRLGDCIEGVKTMPDSSVHYSIFSPPFQSLYTYSASERDMGNTRSDEEFAEHFAFLVSELYRVLMPGRLLSFHCMNLPSTKERDGVIGLKDFRGELIRTFESVGFIYHSEVVIWKDPVTAMQRTKAIGLLHKQLVKDSCMSRQGIPDYLVTMRKPGVNPERVAGTLDYYVGDDRSLATTRDKWKRDEMRDSINIWQRYASPVWMDINPSNTLQRESAREDKDERHICPLQLDVIERGIQLWTNPNDLVYDPFTGIGSTGYVALQRGRRFIGDELKLSYWKQAVANLKNAENLMEQNSLFSEAIA